MLSGVEPGGELGKRRITFQLGFIILLLGGFLLTAFLVLDALGVIGNHYVLTHPWPSVVYLISTSLASLVALLLAGLLFFIALSDTIPGWRLRKGLSIIVGALLVLSVAAVTLRHGILVKATSRAPEDHFPLPTILLAIGIGITLLQIRKGDIRRFGVAFLAIVPALIILAFWLGLRFDPHAITEARAVQIGQAIERYRHDTGQYPSKLAELEPGYLPILLGPLTGRGQAWCYQSGPDFYRLGYVLFERYHQYEDGTPFWEPYYEIKIPASTGQPPKGPWACDNELERMKQGTGFVNTNIWWGMVWKEERGG